MWEADTLVGSFQLRVIAESGVTKITNEDHLVSVQDGSDSYPSEGNELTVILSTACTVRFESNGGTKVEDQIAQYGEKLVKPEDPTREDYQFDGWYKDLDRTTLWNFDDDKVTGNITLYAGWQVVETTPSDIKFDNEIDDYNWIWYLIGVILLLLCLIFLGWPRNKVVFNTMGGSEVKPKRVLKHGKLKMPKPTRKYRQVFGGWYKDESCMIPWDFENDRVTEDMVLYAMWK